MPDRTRRAEVPPFVTKDGSEVRELMHPGASGLVSLAEATLAPGGATTLHRHHRTEELYHIVAGAGEMRLGDRRFRVAAGDTVRITRGTPHKLLNDAAAPLVLLCACAPPYDHDDTELLE